MPGGMRTWDAREHVKVIAGGIPADMVEQIQVPDGMPDKILSG